MKPGPDDPMVASGCPANREQRRVKIPEENMFKLILKDALTSFTEKKEVEMQTKVKLMR